MKKAKRYRIHFIASFNRIVMATDNEDAKRIATELQAIACAAAESSDLQCQWNLIHRLEGD